MTTAKTAAPKVIRSAVIPVVDADSKKLYLKVVEKAKDDTITATAESIATGKSNGLGNDLKAFVAEHPKAAVWASKASNVKSNLTPRSVANQVAFWKRSGYAIANIKEVTAAFGAEIRAKARAMKAGTAEA